MDNSDPLISIIKLIQSLLLGGAGIAILLYHRRLLNQVIARHSVGFGKLFNIEELLKSRTFALFQKLCFILVGVGLIVTALVNILGPISNW